MSDPKPVITSHSTHISLTLPEDVTQNATLLIQRGDLAQLHQFAYTRVADLSEIIAEALLGLADLEANPPVISDPEPVAEKPKPAKPVPSEPTLDVPLKKGTKAVKISHIKIVSGETDAAAYRQAVALAGRLIDGKLWDGQTPIRFEDVYRVAKKMKFLTDKDFSLFELTDFVHVSDESPELLDQVDGDDEPSAIDSDHTVLL
jgi:hypothetical protein